MNYSKPSYNQHRQNSRQEEQPNLDLAAINLERVPVNLYDETAENVAKKIAEPVFNGKNRDANKGTQLRGFYDEIVMWEQKARRMTEAEFQEHLPLIRMLNAKVAYAKGRDLVDINYLTLMKHCLGQVNNQTTLRNCKLFLEAFMGFFKIHGKN